MVTSAESFLRCMLSEGYMNKIHNRNNYEGLRDELSIKCEKCSGLCCTALYFAKTEGFPENKPSGKPCKNLMENFRCSIHEDLISSKMKGCLAYDCFGAGQKVTQNIYRQETFRTLPKLADQIFEVYLIVFRLHQMLWYLIEASTIIMDDASKYDIDVLIKENERMTGLQPEEILRLSLKEHHAQVNKILKKVEKQISKISVDKEQTKDFMGKDLRKQNLVGKDFSMSLLIGANLEGCNLYGSDFLGAGVRDTNVKNADLSESIFLTQMQINAAIGNGKTKLPEWLECPETWEK